MFVLKCMIYIEGYITWILWWRKALENEGQRVSILRRIQIFIEGMVREESYARQKYSLRQQITYTRCTRHPPDEAWPSQPVARRTRHWRNMKEAGPSHTQPDSQTILACGRDRGRERVREIKCALSCFYNWNTCVNLIYDMIHDMRLMEVLYDISLCCGFQFVYRYVEDLSLRIRVCEIVLLMCWIWIWMYFDILCIEFIDWYVEIGLRLWIRYIRLRYVENELSWDVIFCIVH